MAQPTIDEQITELEEELTTLKAQRKEQLNYKEIEEGGNGAKFRTSFDNTTLENRIKDVRIQLTTLYASIS